jgi:hypothetical protein
MVCPTTDRSDSPPQATTSRTETEALSGFLTLDHTSFWDALKMFGADLDGDRRSGLVRRMIGKVVKIATVKHQPTFEILPSEAGGCLVVVIWPKGPEQQLDGFASVEAAQAWIENDGPSWIAGSLYSL